MTVAALSLVGCHGAASLENDGDSELAVGSCGVERWSIKTGTDAAASQINLTPQDTTIATLRGMPVPSGLSSNSGRFTGTAETQVYRLTNVTLVQYKSENDSDYHLVLQDGSSGNSMIAEIAYPGCVSGGPLASGISASRAAMDHQYTVSGSFQTANIPVTVTGVGFFDLLHGQTGVAPNGIELHSVLSICFGLNCAGTTTTPDFSLSANPAAVSTAQGASGTSSIAVAGSGGFTGSVALAASGAPAGATASVSSSVTAGQSGTLTLNAGSAAAGAYTITVTGSAGGNTHATTVAWTISGGGTGGGGITNGGFESGLTGWTSTGAASTSTTVHGGAGAAMVGSTSPSTDSSIAQTFTLPAGATSISFWYRVVCPDTVQYDWASATLKDNTSGATTTVLQSTCTNTGAWQQATANVTGGHSVTLTLSNHDDNYSGDPTYTLYDDVTVVGGGGPSPDFALAASPSSVSSNSGSATISVAGQNGFTGTVALAVSGAPSGATATLSSTSVAAGGSATLSLSAGSAAAGSYTVTVTGTSGSLTHGASVAWTITGSTGGGGVTNGGFESGLTGWTSTGTTSTSTTVHGGAAAAMVGSTNPTTDSSIAQTFTLQAGATSLSFWYRVVCPDTVQYDWASATLRDNTSGTTTTMLASTCSNSGSWQQATANVTGGHSVTLTLSNHDDNYQGDATYTLFDDVAVAGGGGPTPDFVLSAAPSATTGAGSATISVSPQNGFSGTVNLAVSGAPAGASAGLSATSVSAGGSATLSLSPGSAAAGTYTLTVTGTSGSLAHAATVAWTINATATPDFSLAASPGAVTGSGTASISLTALGGFSGSASLSTSGVPSGASASVSPASVSASAPSTLTLTAGTAPAGTYTVTVTGTSGATSHQASVSWTIAPSGGTGLRNVFVIVMENHNWSSIKGSASAPYINGTLLAQGAHAEAYNNVPGLHPSEPNYLWLEAGTNFGITNDGLPSTNHQSSTQHLTTLLQSAGISWKSYQEGISAGTCPLSNSGLYAPKHNPMVFFNDVTNTNSTSSQNCIQHVRPYTELGADLANNTVPRYSFITPNLCNDMHNSSGCATSDAIANGDTWLSTEVPHILNSAAYQNGGVLFITWDESEGGDVPIGMIVLSPKAKAGYSNRIAYSHSSALRTFEEIFQVTPMLGDAANATDLADLFTSFP